MPLHWSSMGTVFSPDAEAALYWLLGSTFTPTQLAGGTGIAPPWAEKLKGMSVFLSLPLSLAFPTRGAFISAYQPSGATTLPEFQMCFLWVSEEVHRRTQSLKQTGPSLSIIHPSLPHRNTVPQHTQVKIFPIGFRGKEYDCIYSSPSGLVSNLPSAEGKGWRVWHLSPTKVPVLPQ